jgi:DTW domain-containing protein YfiP
MVRMAEYLSKKQNAKKERGFCLRCHRSPLTCQCKNILSFDPKIRFVILIHVREAQKRIATGRLAHLCLENSLLLPGYDYSDHKELNALLADPQYHPVILYPGPGSLNLNQVEVKAIFPPGKKPLLFVIDGTWTTARKTLQRSKNLQKIPKICFTPKSISKFHVLRRQPEAHFFSTIEAIHETIELLAPAVGFDTSQKKHDILLQVFYRMVEQQLELSRGPKRKGTAPKNNAEQNA